VHVRTLKFDERHPGGSPVKTYASGVAPPCTTTASVTLWPSATSAGAANAVTIDGGGGVATAGSTVTVARAELLAPVESATVAVTLYVPT
jgi:hypothetical protein